MRTDGGEKNPDIITRVPRHLRQQDVIKTYETRRVPQRLSHQWEYSSEKYQHCDFQVSEHVQVYYSRAYCASNEMTAVPQTTQ